MSIEIDSIKRYQCDQSCTKNTKIIIDLCARGTNLSLKNRDQTNAEEKTRSWISKFNQENARTALISRTHHTNNFMKKINVQIQNLETELKRMDEFHTVPESENSGKIKITHFVSNKRFLGKKTASMLPMRANYSCESILVCNYDHFSCVFAKKSLIHSNLGNFDFPRVFALRNGALLWNSLRS